MTKRANLSTVFNECALRGIVVNIENSCCHTVRQDKPKRNWIKAEETSIDRIIKEIEEEGSSRVVWHCNHEITDMVINIFSDNNYTAVTSKKGNKYDSIIVIIDLDDLPTEFLKEWCVEHNDNTEEEEEERIYQDSEVNFSKEEEDNEIIFHSSEDESENEDESEDNDLEYDKPIIDFSSEDYDETICPKGCKCVNCEDERIENEQSLS